MSEEEKEFKADHFENIEELVKTCKMWVTDDDYDAYCRFFDMGAMEEILNLISNLQKENEELKQLNANQDEMINQFSPEWHRLTEENSNLQKELEYKDDIIHGLGTEVLPISIEGFEVLLNKTKEENNKLQKELDKKDNLILDLKEKLNNIQFEVETAWRKIEKVEDKDE